MTDNERIERLNEIVENMKNTIHSSCDVHLFIDDFITTVDLINRQKAEIDCLRKELEKLHSHKNFLRAEIKRLQAMVDAELDTIHNLGDDYERVLEEENELVKTAKTEAIKEFAERLKKEALKHKIFPLDSCVDIDDIDNLVKEMTE